jgi:hypothetical protein
MGESQRAVSEFNWASFSGERSPRQHVRSLGSKEGKEPAVGLPATTDPGETLRDALRTGLPPGGAAQDFGDLAEIFGGDPTPSRPDSIPANVASMIESIVRRLVSLELEAAKSKVLSAEEAAERAEQRALDLTEKLDVLEARVESLESSLAQLNVNDHPVLSTIFSAEQLEERLTTSIAEAVSSGETLKAVRDEIETSVGETRTLVLDLQARTARNETRLQTVTTQIKRSVEQTAPAPPGAFRKTPESSTMDDDDYTDPPTASRASAPSYWSSWA